MTTLGMCAKCTKPRAGKATPYCRYHHNEYYRAYKSRVATGEVLRNQIAQKEKALATAQETVSRLKAGIRALVKRLQELAMAEWGK
jgi:hypothetical protein